MKKRANQYTNIHPVNILEYKILQFLKGITFFPAFNLGALKISAVRIPHVEITLNN